MSKFSAQHSGSGSPNHTSPSLQGGLSIISFLIIGAFVALTALVLMKVVPTVVEYQAIKKAVVKATSSAPSGAPAEVRAAFDRAAAVDYISSVSGKDLIFEKVGSQSVVSFSYEKKIPLFGPASLLIDYGGNSLAQ